MQSEVTYGETINPASSQEVGGTTEHSNSTERNRVADSLAQQPTIRTQVVDANEPAKASTPAEASDASLQLADDLRKFHALAVSIRERLQPAESFDARCDQMFSVANDLFGHAPTWVCFFREVLSSDGIANVLFANQETYGKFIGTTHYHQVEQMLTALRSRDLPENDPNDPQRMITVRLPKSLHETLCHEAGRLNISVNKLCISRLLQKLDVKMIPESSSKPRGRKPRTHVKADNADAAGQVGF